MSEPNHIKAIEDAGLLSKEMLAQLKRNARARVRILKGSVRRIDSAAKRFAQKHRDPKTGRWDSIDNKIFFRRQFAMVHSRLEIEIRSLGGGKRVQEFDPY